MVYVEKPVSSGFSYGKPQLTTLDEAADKFVKTQMAEWAKLVKTGKISVD